MLIELSRLESPLGALTLAVVEGELCALDFNQSEAPVRSWLEKVHPGARMERGTGGEATEKLAAYFAGELHALEDIPITMSGTEFQKKVWRALRRIPVGETRSYRDVAKAIGSPDAVRAVGAANGRNPIAVVVPCHRVIASNGTMWGYGGGLWRKEWLLRHERLAGSA